MALPEQDKKHLLFESNTRKEMGPLGIEPVFRKGHRSVLLGFHSVLDPLSITVPSRDLKSR